MSRNGAAALGESRAPVKSAAATSLLHSLGLCTAPFDTLEKRSAPMPTCMGRFVLSAVASTCTGDAVRGLLLFLNRLSGVRVTLGALFPSHRVRPGPPVPSRHTKRSRRAREAAVERARANSRHA